MHKDSVASSLDKRLDAVKESVRNLVDVGGERAGQLRSKAIDVKDAVVENSGAGSFSDEWVGLRSIQSAFDRAPRSEPVSAYMLLPLFRGKSSNCCYFCAAVLKSEGLLRPSEKRKKRFDRVDQSAWLADLRNRADGRAAGAAGEKSGKKPAAAKTVAELCCF